MVLYVGGWEADFVAYAQARGPSLRNLAYLVCHDWHHANDCAQTTLIKLYLSWRRIDRRASIDSYARVTLVRTVLAERRRPWRRERVTAELPDRDEPAAADVVAQRMAIAEALAALPARQRAAVVLRYWEDLSVSETAEVLGRSEGTVKSQAAKGIATLRKLLTVGQA